MIDPNEILEQFYDIPFENSDYQNVNYVLNAQLTPERAYRALALRLMNKIRTLKECQHGIKKSDIDRREKLWKIEHDTTLNSFDIERLELELEQLDEGKGWQEKLANDAVRECNLLHSELQKYPKYTREQFEIAEQSHYELRMIRQSQVKDDSLNSLINSTLDSKFIENALAKQKELGVDEELKQRCELTNAAKIQYLGLAGVLKLENNSDE